MEIKKALRKERSTISQFDYYTVEQYVFARFSDPKLVYLAIAISGEGD